MACSDIFSSTVVVISVRVICIRLSLNSVDFELSSLPSIKWESHIQLDKGLFRTKMAFPGKRELFFRVSSDFIYNTGFSWAYCGCLWTQTVLFCIYPVSIQTNCSISSPVCWNYHPPQLCKIISFNMDK
jgi:hypothetical protein